ncbi:MAG: DUF1488 domain-containing protein [Candidatus Sedimenticola sp. (ex Thyasira tokunagai)]
MKLHFPNPSRSFDESHNRVLFWGYDKTMEVSFYLETAALKRLCPMMNNAEAEFLKAFDTSREKIYEVADKIYRRGGGGKGTYAYVLVAEDF